MLYGQYDFDNLYKIGREAFDRDDYVYAYSHLLAYWHILRYESERMNLSVDDAFNQEVLTAVNYSGNELYKLRNKVTELELENKRLRDELASSRNIPGISSKAQPLGTQQQEKPLLRSQPPGR